mmetsp:Transcript_18291/g.42693  ORF Transcript_18291/g.42693 Transcript_18291/m.42693 type:complete len:206 (-) Transcript_18291:8526-9143(-)
MWHHGLMADPVSGRVNNGSASLSTVHIQRKWQSNSSHSVGAKRTSNSASLSGWMAPVAGAMTKELAVGPSIRQAYGAAEALVFLTTKRNTFFANMTVGANGMDSWSQVSTGGPEGSKGSSSSLAGGVATFSGTFSSVAGLTTLPWSSRGWAVPSNAAAGTVPSPRKSKRKKFERGSDPETTEASNTAAKLARCGGWKDTSICWES